MIDLSQFCRGGSFVYGDTDNGAPFSIDEYTYSTNGHIAVRVPRRADVPEIAEDHKGIRAPHLFDEAFGSATDFQPLMAFEAPPRAECRYCHGTHHLKNCPTCDGVGEVDCPTCKNPHDCPICEGRCEVPAQKGEADAKICDGCFGEDVFDDADRVQFGEIHIAPRYALLVRSLPNVTVCISGPPGNPMPFRFDGGEGLVMPLRQDVTHGDAPRIIVALMVC